MPTRVLGSTTSPFSVHGSSTSPFSVHGSSILYSAFTDPLPLHSDVTDPLSLHSEFMDSLPLSSEFMDRLPLHSELKDPYLSNGSSWIDYLSFRVRACTDLQPLLPDSIGLITETSRPTNMGKNRIVVQSIYYLT